MTPKITFISRLFIVAVASSLPVFAVYGQNTGEATTGGDAHPTTDSPYLRRSKATPGASAAAATKLSQKDQKFLAQIAAGGVQAVEDAKVAQREGGPGVKGIASRIVNERGRSNQELLDLTKKKGLGLGTGKIKARNIPKSNFDQQFTHTLARDYEEDLRLLQTAASSADDKDIKAWAARTIPMVKAHLAMLREAKGSAKAKPKE
jgi:putative membrane protein